MKLFILFVIYGLDGKTTSGETTLRPGTGLLFSTSSTSVGLGLLHDTANSRPSPSWFDEFLRESFGCRPIELPNLQPSTSRSIDLSSSGGVPTTQDENNISRENFPYECEAGPSCRHEAPSYQGVPSGSVDQHLNHYPSEECSPPQLSSCHICGKSFNRKFSLKRHMLSHSEDLQLFSCELCGVNFKRTDHLKSHMRCHAFERPFPCKLCDMTFKRKNHLECHKKTHSENRPFPCELCGSRFITKPRLDRHMKSHSNERPCICEICDQRFKEECALKNHKRTHSNERPFACDHCSKSFKFKDTLRRHLDSHRKNRPRESLFPPTFCAESSNRRDNLAIHTSTHGQNHAIQESQTIGKSAGPSQQYIPNHLKRIGPGIIGKCPDSGIGNSEALDQPTGGIAASNCQESAHESPPDVSFNEIMRMAVEVAFGSSCVENESLFRILTEPHRTTEQAMSSTPEP